MASDTAATVRTTSAKSVLVNIRERSDPVLDDFDESGGLL